MIELHEKFEKTIEFFESKEVDRLGKMVRLVTLKLESTLAERDILARVSSRVKSSQSLKSKFEKWALDPIKATWLEQEPQDILYLVNDLAAARITTYTEKDRDAVAEVVQELFSCPGHYKAPFDLEKKEEHSRIKTNDDNHYRATHMMLAVHEDDLSGEFSNLKNDKCELQITSLLAHVWNEIEHDTVYKNLSGDLSILEKESINSLGNLTRTGDAIIKSLLRARDAREDREQVDLKEEGARFSNADELTEFLHNHYGPKINGKKIDYRWGANELLSCLRAVNWHHPRNIALQFSPNFLQIARGEAFSLKRFLERNNRKLPLIDVEACDLFIIGLMIKKSDELNISFKGMNANKREKSILKAFEEKLG